MKKLLLFIPLLVAVPLLAQDETDKNSETPAVETPAVVDDAEKAEEPAVVDDAEKAEKPALEAPAVVDDAEESEKPAVEEPAVIDDADKQPETDAEKEKTDGTLEEVKNFITF